jgi:hypothetical protein
VSKAIRADSLMSSRRIRKVNSKQLTANSRTV